MHMHVRMHMRIYTYAHACTMCMCMCMCKNRFSWALVANSFFDFTFCLGAHVVQPCNYLASLPPLPHPSRSLLVTAFDVSLAIHELYTPYPSPAESDSSDKLYIPRKLLTNAAGSSPVKACSRGVNRGGATIVSRVHGPHASRLRFACVQACSWAPAKDAHCCRCRGL